MDQSLENIKIETPFGDAILQSEELYKFIKKCTKDIKDDIDEKHQDIYEFLESDDPQNEYRSLEAHKVSAYLPIINSIIKENYVCESIYDYSKTENKKIPPTFKECNYSLREKQQYLIEGYMFLKHQETNDKMVLSLSPYYAENGPHLEIEGFYLEGGRGLREFWEEVEVYFDKYSPLKNAKINTNWEFIEYKNLTLDNIVLDEIKMKLLNRNIIHFIENQESYSKRRLPTSRGILLTGPPGTGKTLCCETLMNLLDCTVIYVSSDTVDKRGIIKEVYTLAKRLSPTLVIVEDIDTLGGLDRRDNATHPLLGEFLNCLSGIGGNDGVITIATTNYPDNLDEALRDRPGRFDMRIEMGLPSLEVRKHILLKYLEEFETEDLDILKIAHKTKGLSGAHLREIVISSYMISLEENCKINLNIMGEAYESVLSLKDNNYLGAKINTLYQ